MLLAMIKRVTRKILDVFSTVIVSALVFGPAIILVAMLLYTGYGRVDSIINGKVFHSPFEKKVYYTIEGECYHDSINCPTLQRSEHVYSAYKDELSGRTHCMQCNGWR